MTIDNEAYRKFVASAPTAQREFRTIELFHPQFSEVLRFVEDNEDQTLTLESDAPRNAGEDVLFTALSMKITEPGEAQSIDQVLSVQLGALGNEVQDQVDRISGEENLTPIEVIYRKYYSGDLGDPVLVVETSASTLRFEGYNAVAFTGEDTDFATARSGEIYTLERFPTLRGV